MGSERMFKCLANQYNTHVTKDTLMKGVHQLNVRTCVNIYHGFKAVRTPMWVSTPKSHDT